MFFSSEVSQVRGDAAWMAREKRQKRQELFIQLAAGLVLFICVMALARNVMLNLEARGIQHGFEFLSNAAGFEIGESMIPFQASDSFLKAFVIGIMNTVKVSVLTIITATLLGIAVAFMKLSSQPVLRFLGWAHVEFYRNIPLIVGLLGVYLVITEVLPDMETVMEQGSGWLMLDKAGLQFAAPVHNGWACLLGLAAGLVTGEAARRFVYRRSTFLVAWVSAIAVFAVTAVLVWTVAGFVSGWEQPHLEGFVVEGGGALSPEFLALWFGLTLFMSAPIAEVFRAGILSVGRDQWSAGQALGLTGIQTASYVIFPQAMKLSIPPLASQYMNLTKNSSLAVIVGYPDVVCIGNTSINSTGQALEMICLIMIVYLLLNLITAAVMNALNARVTARSAR